MGIEDDCFNRRKRKGIDKRHRREEAGRESRNNTANNSSHPDLKLYGMPIKFVENVFLIFGFIGVVYLLFVSKVLFAGITAGAIGKSVFSILILIVMAFTILLGRGITDIIAKDIVSFRRQFSSRDEDGNVTSITRITTSDQIALLMKIAINIVKGWKVSWFVYIAFIAVLYIIVCYIGPFLTVLLLLIMLVVIALKLPEISDILKKYLKSKTRNIPADPPSIGVMTLFGNPLFDLILGPGIAIVYPGIIDFLVVEVHKEPQDFKDMKGFITKDNISVELDKVQVLYIPDTLRIEKFIEAKKQEGVYDVLDSMISNKLKDIIRSLSFADLLSQKGDLELEVKSELTGKEKEDKEIRDMGRNGISDDHLLGVVFYRFNIGSINPSAEYIKQMEKKQIEERQKEAELTEIGTEIAQAWALFEAYKLAEEPKSFEECLAMVKDDKIAREGHHIIPGLRKALNSFDPMIIVEIIKEMKKQ